MQFRQTLGAALLLTLFFAQHAHARSQDCVNSPDYKNILDQSEGSTLFRPFSAIVALDDVATFVADNSAQESGVRLSFNQTVQILEQGRNRVLIRANTKNGPEEVWALPNQLHCGNRAIRKPGSVEYKAFVRGRFEINDEVPPRYAQTRQGISCDAEGPGCVAIRPFDIFFVADRDGNEGARDELFLLSRKANLFEGEDALLGWVERTQIELWDTAVGLRAVQEPQHDKPLCAYESVEDAVSGDNCVEGAYGPSWLTDASRMMVLDSDTGQDGDGFPVVEVLAEVGSVINVTPSQTVTVETPVPSQDQPEDGTITRAELTQRVTHHDYVDVQFIIDGTRSMDAAFDAIKGSGGRAGVVQTLKEQIASELSGSKVRFGFTIYGDRSRNKDNPYGESGLGASFFINQRSGCGSAIDDREIARNARDFQQRFNRVTIEKVVQSPESEIVKRIGSDDWEENVAGGLEAGFTGIEACPWHRKIVILIGDSGYSRDNQVAHGFGDAPSFSSILSNIQESRTDPLAPPVLVLGVQMPPSVQSENFDRAYELFPDQVADLIAAVSPEIGDFYKVPSTEGAAGSISDRIGALLEGQASTLAFKCALESNTGISFSVDCGGGELPATAPTTGVPTTNTAARVETVSGEEVKSQAGGVPFNMASLQNRLAALRCSDCSGMQGEVEGLILYVRLDPDVFQPEVLMTDEDLSSWKDIANRLAQEEKLSDQRRNVQLILLGSAEGQLGIRWRNSNAKLHEFLGAAMGLPELFQTPILSYKYRDFQSEALVGNCELGLLQEFAEQSSEMLEIIQNGRRPVPVVSGITGGCESLSSAGEGIPRFANVAAEPFGTWVNPKTGEPEKTGYRYEGLRDGDTENIYWTPNWALP